MAAARRGPVAESGSPGGDPQLLADEVDPGDELADRVLDLEPRVQLDEVERAVGAEQELERAGVPVADRARGPLGRVLHLLAQLRRRAPGDGDSSISFWWRRWIEHSRSPSVSTPPWPSASTWISTCRAGDDRLLDVERRVAERRLRLGGRGLERALELVGLAHEPHALAAAARRPP